MARLNHALRLIPLETRQLLGDEFQFTRDMVNDFLLWISEGVIYAGSDGSVKEGQGAHSFTFTSGMKKTKMWGSAARTPRTTTEMSSQRAEHAGSISIMVILNILQKALKERFCVQLWVDNAEVIWRGQESLPTYWNDTLVLDYDMWRLSNVVQGSLKYTLTWEKVDSHIEEKIRNNSQFKPKENKLSWRLNEYADKLAGNTRETVDDCEEILFPQAAVMVEHRAGFWYGSIMDRVVDIDHAIPLQNYLCDKFNWTEVVFHSIHWEAMGIYTKRLTGVANTNLTKFTMDWQNDNRQNETFYGKSGKCPACLEEDEDHMHFVWCEDPVLRTMNARETHKVYSSMKKSKTAGIIYRMLTIIIEACCVNMEPTELEYKRDAIGTLIHQAWDEQKQIGWFNLLKGRLSKKWGEAQEKFYRQHPDTRTSKHHTGLGWTIKMIQIITTMSLAMWANCCGCLHGHDVKEKNAKEKEKIQITVQKCYQKCRTLPSTYKYMFSIPVSELIKNRSISYIQSWIQSFYSIQLQCAREKNKGVEVSQGWSDEESISTVDTADLDDYLIETDSKQSSEDESSVDGFQMVSRDHVEIQDSQCTLAPTRSGALRNMWESWGKKAGRE